MFLYVAIVLNTLFVLSTYSTTISTLFKTALNLNAVTALFKTLISGALQVLPFLYVLMFILFVRALLIRKCTAQASSINNIYSKK